MHEIIKLCHDITVLTKNQSWGWVKAEVNKINSMCCNFVKKNWQWLKRSEYNIKNSLLYILFLFIFRGHINVISSCCFSKDEHLLATGSWDKNIQIWDIATGVYRYATSGCLQYQNHSVKARKEHQIAKAKCYVTVGKLH